MVQMHPVSDGERDLGEVAFPGIVPRLGEEAAMIRWLGPDLGEHNEEIYGQLLGLDEERRAALRETGVI